MWPWRANLCLGGELLTLFDRLLDGPDHVEGRLRQVIVFALNQSFEAANRISEIDQYAGCAGEYLRDVEWLRQEALDLARAGHSELILLRQFVHPQDCDDVLQRLVALQDLLDLAGNLVVLLAD